MARLLSEMRRIRSAPPFWKNSGVSVKKYADAAGSIRINNTGVQYYVFQHDDNAYYVDHNRDGRKSPSGEIFLDYRCGIQPLSRHMILYGHNLFNFSMFSSLGRYKKQSFCMRKPGNPLRYALRLL